GLELGGDERAGGGVFRVGRGVGALRGTLATRRGAAGGLGTGNPREGARRKLERAGLDGHFRFGGFGSDHEDRAELLRIGAGRGATWLGYPPGACRTIVIGDTPHDVAAARAIGADSLGVATGGCRVEALRAAAPTWGVSGL